MNKTKGRAPVGASLVVLSSLIYASYGVWITLMGSFFGDYIQAVLRGLLVLLLLIPIATYRKQLVHMHWRRDVWWFIGMLVGAALVQAPLYYAVIRIGVGLGIGISYAGIVLGAFFFGWLFGGERYTKDKWVSTIFGVVGLWLIFSPSVHTLGIVALGAALLSGLSSGAVMVFNKEIKYGALQTTILTWFTTIFANLVFVLLLHEKLPALSANIHWLYLVLFALASLIASSALIGGIKRIEAGAAGILGLLEIVFGVVYGVLFFHEHPSPLALLGMASIVIAAAIPYIQHYSSAKGTITDESAH